MSTASSSAASPAKKSSGAEHEILFQRWFKSVGPRTYAVQVKKANNGNHYLVLTEGKRDEKTDEVRKTRLFLFSEDFVEFFKMLHETAVFVRENPVPEGVKKKRERFWSRRGSENSRSPETQAELPPGHAGASTLRQEAGRARPGGPRSASTSSPAPASSPASGRSAPRR